MESQPQLLSPCLLKFDYSKLDRVRIRESCSFQTSRRQPTPLELVTDLVEFPRTTGAHSLLVYSVIQNGKSQKLVTCFPIDALARKTLIDQANENQTPIVTRFNLAVPDFPTDGVRGKRQVQKLKL